MYPETSQSYCTANLTLCQLHGRCTGITKGINDPETQQSYFIAN